MRGLDHEGELQTCVGPTALGGIGVATTTETVTDGIAVLPVGLLAGGEATEGGSGTAAGASGGGKCTGRAHVRRED